MSEDRQTAEMPGNEDPQMSRRGFLEWMIGFLGGVAALSAAGTALAYLKPPRGTEGKEGPVEVADKEDIPVGEGRVVPFKGTTAIVIHTQSGFVAFSAVCTHAGCIVQWQKDKNRIYCPCHAAVFDVEGNVVSGPPPRPLPKYRVKVQGEKIILAEA